MSDNDNYTTVLQALLNDSYVVICPGAEHSWGCDKQMTHYKLPYFTENGFNAFWECSCGHSAFCINDEMPARAKRVFCGGAKLKQFLLSDGETSPDKIGCLLQLLGAPRTTWANKIMRIHYNLMCGNWGDNEIIEKIHACIK